MMKSVERDHLTFVLTLVVLVGFGCATSVESRKDRGTEEKENEGGLTDRYEKLFNPSDYNPSLAAIEKLAQADRGVKAGDARPTEVGSTETILGFRIQLLSTTEIDTANAVKNELSSLPESVGIYVIYDSPYYKVRVGDFLSRPAGNQLLKQLIERGYTDPWIVADRILKNPPSRRATTQPTKPQE